MTLEETVNLNVQTSIGEGWEVVAHACLVALASAIGTALPFTIGESTVAFAKDEASQMLSKAVWEDTGGFIIHVIVAPIGEGMGEYSSEQAKWVTIGGAVGVSVVKKFVKREPSIKYYKGR